VLYEIDIRLIYCAFVGINYKLYESIVCTKLTLVSMCVFVVNIITYISLHFLNAGDI